MNQITVPTLIATSEHDYVSIDCAIAMKAAMKKAQLHVFKGCSHAPYYEDPIQYHTVLSSFLNEQICQHSSREVSSPECV